MALMDSFSAHVLLDQISFQDVLELRFFSIFDFHNFHMGFINNKKKCNLYFRSKVLIQTPSFQFLWFHPTQN